MKFNITETIGTTGRTMRLGSGDTPNDRHNDKDVGKIVVLVGDSRMDIAPVGSPIESFTLAVDTATSDGYSTGSVADTPLASVKQVTFDGKQADGTGNHAIGDLVVTGTQPAKGVPQAGTGPKVRKATDQAAAAAAPFKWRVVSLGKAATGAPGTVGMIERI